MRRNLVTALTLALLSSMLPGCDRVATDREEAASRGGTAGQTPAGGATGQASEGSTASDSKSGSKAPR